MEIYILIAISFIIVLVLAVAARHFSPSSSVSKVSKKAEFIYERKEFLMTPSENEFFSVLTEVAGDRYYVFPQIHLASLFTNKTVGKYYKLGFQRINRASVDYVLCDRTTLKPVYAVELDDSSHQRSDRRFRDEAVEQIFKDMNMPLIRFKDYRSLSKEQISQRFYEASQQV